MSAAAAATGAPLAVDVSGSGVRSPLAVRTVAEIARRVLRAERVREAMLSIALVSRAEIARLNRTHLGHAGPTDVISFGFRQVGEHGPVIGDVYISPEVARENARAEGGSVREEVGRLVVHGVLHVLGYEHPGGDADDRARSPMWRRQERYVRRFVAAPRRAEGTR